MTRPNSAAERELIQEQLLEAKKTLARLKKISNSPNQSENSSECRESAMSGESPNYLLNEETHSSSRAERRRRNSQPRISTAARDNLVQALGYQVSKLEDDLKASLLSYFEQVERQKGDLIDSFNVMQKKLLNHQQTYQQQNQEAAEKDRCIRQLKDEKRRLENQVERLQSEHNTFENSSFTNGLDSSFESLNSDSISYAAASSQTNSGYASDKSEMCEKFLQENARLREMLRQQDNLDCSRLERKVDLQKKLCNSYDKDLASKDILIKRIKAENKGLQSDVQTMQEEVLRVNASRLNAEHEKTKLQQDIKLKEDEIFALREKLAGAIEDKEALKTYIEQSDLSNTSNGDESLPNFDEGVFELQSRCGSYKEKLKDKEKFINSMKRDQQEMIKDLDALRRELGESNNEVHRLKRENERLQRENADRDIHRLSSESSTKASTSRINQLKDKIADAEQEIRELKTKCQESEKREADLSKEVLSSLEKYTQVEQELFTTKKELAHLRGYSESNERRKNELQGELLSAKENISRLQKNSIARNSKYHHGNRDNMDDLESENMQLKEDVTRLDEALNSNKLELNQLENDIESLREQCSIQKVRLDGQETMISRKDERIKELQDELVEVHNQNDALTDEILKKNRDNLNLKMNNIMAEQETELLKSVPMSNSHPHRDPLYSHIESPTSDSGFSDSQRRHPNREKLSEKSKPDFWGKEMVLEGEIVQPNEASPRKSNNGMDNQHKLQELLEENASLKEENAEVIATVKELQANVENMATKSQQFEEKERIIQQEFEDKENDLLKALDDMQQELSDVQNKNNELGAKLKDLERNRNGKDDPQQWLLHDLSSVESTPVVNTQTKHLIDAPAVQQEQVEYLVDAANDELINFDEPMLYRSEPALQNSSNTTDYETATGMEDRKDEIKSYETQIESIYEDKKQLESEVEKLRELLEQAQREQEKGSFRNDLLSKELANKDERVATLEKELQATQTKCKEQISQVENLETILEEKEESLRNANKKCVSLERKATESKNKYEEIKKIVDQSNEKENQLENDLELTETKLIDLENEIAESQAETMKIVSKCRELQREKRNLEEDLELIRKDKNKMDKKFKETEKEKDDALQKLEEAKQQMKDLRSEQRRLQEERDDLDFDVNEMMKQKNREIKKLTEDLEVSENKYEDLMASLDSSTAVSSNLKTQLMTAKEECKQLTNKNEQLYGFKKELVKDLEDKVKQIESLRATEGELRNGINTREKELEKLREKCKELQDDNTTLQEERVDLRKAIDLTSDEQKAVDNQVEMLKENLDKAQGQLQEDQEKISILMESVDKGEHENDVLKEKLNKIEKRLAELQKREENAQTDLLNAEKRMKASEKKVKELTNALHKNNEEMGYLQNKLTKAENTISSLEEAQSTGEEEQKALQRKLLDATNQISELTSQEKDHEDRQRNIDKRVTDLRNYSEELEAERDDLEFSVKELKKKLEKQKKKVEALEEEAASKQDEKDFLAQELDLLKRNLSETETEQSASASEKEKLKKEIHEASKKIMDLEAENDALNENIEELEKLLDNKRAAVLDLEDSIKETSESAASLRAQHDEDKRLVRSLKEDNQNLEKMLEKQRQLSEGYKSSLSQKDAEISKLILSRDDTEDSLQLLKKDLARREGVSKADREELEEVEKQLTETNKKLQETKLANENVLQENENLKKEVDNLRRRCADLDTIQPENFVNVLEVEPLSSRKSSSSSVLSLNVADSRIKTLDDKLTKAQTKVTDLENELSKEIRKHEIDCIKTRPTFPFSYGSKRSGFYDVSGFNEKYGLSKKSESSDSDFSSSNTAHDMDSKTRGPDEMKKSMDSSDQSLDRESDIESKGTPKSFSVASSTPPQSPVIPVFSFDLSDENVSKDRKQVNTMDSLVIQVNDDSGSEATSRGDGDYDGADEVFEHSIGNLNDLLSEMNEAEKNDPILQQYLLDQTGPEETSSPRNDSFDAIQPTYITRREQPNIDFPHVIHPEKSTTDVKASSSDLLLDLTASDITNVTDLTEPVQKQSQLLLDLDTLVTNKKEENTNKRGIIDLSSSGERKPNVDIEEPSVFGSDEPSEVIDPFSTPFDIPNWEDEFDSSFDIESSNNLMFDDRPDKQSLLLVDRNDVRESSIDDDATVKDIVKPKFETKTEVDVGNDLIIESRERDDSPESKHVHDQANLDKSLGFKDVAVDIDVDNDIYGKDNKVKQSEPNNTDHNMHTKSDVEEDKGTQRTTGVLSSDEEPEFRKPSDIIKQLEDSSFSIGKPGMKPPRPKKREHQPLALGDEPLSHQGIQKPEPKPRGKQTMQHRSEQNTDHMEGSSEDAEAPTPVPKQRYIDLETTEGRESEEEDRLTAIGRQRVMNLIAAFEGKEV